ncbi:hypothetical protein HNQ07_004700 [Deinococcus metalli]|nr:hypothetical protein [Deinococcus metalli]MBB5379185.1 hypothetical protein [Deinococcus metalli]
MNPEEPQQWALNLRAARLTPISSHPRSMALLIACAPHQVPWAFAAADTAVSHGRPPGDVLTNLLDYLEGHPMPIDEGAWAALVATL